MADQNDYIFNFDEQSTQENTEKELVNPYQEELLTILIGIIEAYKLMLSKEYKIFENQEEIIRNMLYEDFLKSAKTREKLGLSLYKFIPEGAEIDSDNYKTKGYTDLKVINLIKAIESDNFEYIIECKRLDGGLNLNRKYITEGVMRFVEEYKYPLHHHQYAMLGFIVETIQSFVSIDNNISEINQLVVKEDINVNFQQPITKIPSDFKYIYQSLHQSFKGNSIVILHLMLDYSSKF